jgi:hypothetical protein
MFHDGCPRTGFIGGGFWMAAFADSVLGDIWSLDWTELRWRMEGGLWE